jgi:hypothetical protein
VRFDTTIAVVIRDDHAAWQKMNVTAFLVSGIAMYADGKVVDRVLDRLRPHA